MGSIAQDVHAHLAPIDAARLSALPGVSWNAADESLLLDGHRVGMKDLFHPERLVARMDVHGVQRALVSIPPPLYRQALAEADALAWVRYVNEAMLAIARGSAGRLGALFYLPLEHPALLAGLQAEYERSEFEGIALAAGGHADIVYSEPRYEALWQWLNEKGAFVFVHPGTCADRRLAAFYLENLLGNPVETGVAGAHLVMAGVPGRYPRIRFCLAHAGGIFTSILGRLQRGFDTRRPGVNLGVEPPLQAGRRFYVDCIAHSVDMLALAGAMLGEDHVLYGSDWPFPMGLDPA
jgi:aminocarboxymuconate-semialdehyde decarboxylase